VDHKDLEMPSFMTRKDYMVIEERNKKFGSIRKEKYN